MCLCSSGMESVQRSTPVCIRQYTLLKKKKRKKKKKIKRTKACTSSGTVCSFQVYSCAVQQLTDAFWVGFFFDLFAVRPLKNNSIVMNHDPRQLIFFQ